MGSPATGPVADTQTGGVGTAGDRAALVAEISARVGSTREARWIVEHAESTADARSGSDEAVAIASRTLADRRAGGEPLQYVLGRWPFRQLELVVDRRVLIPRPETEQLVDLALAELRRMERSGPDRGGRLCIDLGTGSGAIALSLATEVPDAVAPLEVWATDASSDALAVARANLSALAAREGVHSNVHFALGRWFDALPTALAGEVHLIVSNPPYVAEDELEALDATVRDWEPVEALVAASGSEGTPGLSDVEQIVATAPHWLHESGSLVIELAPHQAHAAAAVARHAGFEEVTTERDLAGRTRFLVARRT